MLYVRRFIGALCEEVGCFGNVTGTVGALREEVHRCSVLGGWAF